MAEFEYQNSEAWNTAVKLATSVGRLKVGSNLRASQEAQAEAFKQAGLAAALIAEATLRDGPGQPPLYRDARGALAQCRAWLHILASLMNEQDSVFLQEFELAEQAARQLGATIRMLERGSLPSGPARPPVRGPGQPARPGTGGPPRQGGLR